MTTTLNKRSGNKWNVNELLSLQREYELLKMNTNDIAIKHGRSEVAILYKLEEEGLLEPYGQLYLDIQKNKKDIK